MRASFRQGAPADTQADTLCFGLFEGEEAPADLDRALGGRLAPPDRVRRGEGLLQEGRGAAPRRRRSAPPARSPSASASGQSSRPSARASPAAVGLARARDAGATRVAWAVPDGVDQTAVGAALAEGTLLAAYRFDRYKSGDDDNGSKGPEEVEIVSGEDLSDAIREVDVVAEHQNTARDLQNLPSNDLTPVEAGRARAAPGGRDRGPRGRRLRPRRDRSARDGRPARPSRRARTRSRASSCCATTAGAAGRCSRWSARRSPSTPAESRSSPRRRCRR